MTKESKVSRYDPWCTESTAFMEHAEDGDYVTHADYRALEEELAALRVRVGELVEAVRMEDNVRASIETSRIESASAALRTALAGCTEAKNEAVRSIA